MGVNEKLTSIANAIRRKTGKSGTLTLDQMATEINGIQTSTGEQAMLVEKSVTANGSYLASDDSADGYSKVTVAVPEREIKLQSVQITPSDEMQQKDPPSGFDGFGRVTVFGVPTETKTITTNGTHTPTAGKFFDSVTVNVPSTSNPKLQSKTVSARADSTKLVRPDIGYDGLSNVVVNKVTADIDSNIKPENIKNGITVLGVTGTLQSGGGGASDPMSAPITIDADITTTGDTLLLSGNSWIAEHKDDAGLVMALVRGDTTSSTTQAAFTIGSNSPICLGACFATVYKGGMMSTTSVNTATGTTHKLNTAETGNYGRLYVDANGDVYYHAYVNNSSTYNKTEIGLSAGNYTLFYGLLQ